MSGLVKLVIKILAVVLLGGFLGATLVRLAPGFGVDEEELDARLSHQSIQALRQAQSTDQNLAIFYFHYLSRVLHGDLGTSRTLQRPVSQLLAERMPETLKSIGLGLAFAWTLALSLAIAIVMSRAWYLDFGASVLAGT